MPDQSSPPKANGPAPQPSQRDQRTERLAEALRANLRRRKAAGRTRHDPEPVTPETGDEG